MFALTSFLFTETQTETADNALPLADSNESKFCPKIQFVPHREQYVLPLLDKSINVA
jgi:hypothetical protein